MTHSSAFKFERKKDTGNTLVLPEGNVNNCKDPEQLGSFINYLSDRYGSLKIEKNKDGYKYVITILEQ